LSLLIINPIEFPRWNESLRSLPGHSFFHTASWAKTLQISYGYQPYYFTLWEGGRLSALLPCMGIVSRLTGKRGVCLPFTDYCEPIVSDAAQFPEMFAAAVDFGNKRKWKYLEIRGGESFSPKEEPSEWHYGHTLDLTVGPQKILSGLRDSTRRNILKAEKAGIEITVTATPEALKVFCRLNDLTRRDHGLPPQPSHFFRNVQDQILSQEMGFVVLASSGGTAIAANIYFCHGDQLIYKYGASDTVGRDLRANNLVMWEAIKSGRERGHSALCFGRTEPQNEGLRQFKAGWGGRERIIKYYRYGLPTGTFIKAPVISKPVYQQIFSKLPTPVLKLLGSILYRHMG